MKATKESHSKCWAEWLDRRSISPTLEDANISFNHLLYYSMSRGDSRAKRDRTELDGSGIDDVEIDSGEVGDNEIGKKGQNLSKSKNSSKSKKTESGFLASGVRKTFIELKQAFIKAPILYHYDSECHIRVEMDVSGYAIGGVLSQLISDDSDQWHPVAFFSRKMILAATSYETYNGELSATVEAFKTWRHYLKGSQHEVLVLTDQNNLRRFIETKSLSSRQVRWAQKLFRYHFWIDYYQGKANKADDALSRYPQQGAKKEETLRAKNVKILHRLQSLLAKVSGFSASQLSSSQLSPLHQIFICGITVFPQLCQFWNFLQNEIALESSYTNIRDMRLRLPELEEKDEKAKAFRAAGFPEN